MRKNKRVSMNSTEIFSFYSEIKKFIWILTDDLDKAVGKVEEMPEDESWRRIVIRTSATCIEATCLIMKETTLLLNKFINKKTYTQPNSISEGF